MKLNEYLQRFNLSFEEMRSKYPNKFIGLSESTRFDHIKNFLDELESSSAEIIPDINEVINKIHDKTYFFEKADTPKLSIFIAKGSHWHMANFINTFKEGTLLDDKRELQLFELFNAIKQSSSIKTFTFKLNKTLRQFLPHLFSIIKHIQDKIHYPPNYPYYHRILTKVLQGNSDYDSLCKFYVSFPDEERSLIFSVYMELIGNSIIQSLSDGDFLFEPKSAEHKALERLLVADPQKSKLVELIATRSNPSGDPVAMGSNNHLLSELVKIVQIIGDIDSVRKFFRSVKHVLTNLNLSNEDKIVYASAIQQRIQLTIGGRYVVSVEKKSEKAMLGFYIQNSHLEQIKAKYAGRLEIDEKSNAVKQKRTWLMVGGKEIDETDFYGGILSLAVESVQGQATSQYRSQYEEKHNPFIIKAALDDDFLETLFVKYYLLGAFWKGSKTEDKTGRFVASGIWENGYDDKYLEQIKSIQPGSQIAIKSAFTRERTRSVMAIKARGVVTENKGDGKKLIVDWEENFKPFEVDFSGGYWSTVSQVDNDQHIEAIWGLKKTEIRTASINQILFGPPGTGKTYNTINKAIELIEPEYELTQNREKITEKYRELLQEGRIVFTTFHQSMSYEDFVEGIKPNLSNHEDSQISYHIEDGIFKQLCNHAEKDQDRNYVLIIDEINRGNISAIFGELITLIEEDKRINGDEELRVALPYSKEKGSQLFGVPANLSIIGTMNTADRSVEALDTALRRRFSFIEMFPDYEVLEKFGKLKGEELNIDGEGVDLVKLLKDMNERIEVLLDRDHLIGHSYFMKVTNESELRHALGQQIIPLLQEYFYGDFGKIALVLGRGFCVRDSQNNHKHLFAPGVNYDTEMFEEKTIYRIIDPSQKSGGNYSLNSADFAEAISLVNEELKAQDDPDAQ